MRLFYSSVRTVLYCTALLLITFGCPALSRAQQLTIKDFVLFGGGGHCPAPGQTTPVAPGCAVYISSNTQVLSGAVGSHTLVKTSSAVTMKGDILSWGSVELGNENNISGSITVGGSAGTVLLVGNNGILSGNIGVMGNTVIGGSSVTGTLTHPDGTTYSGPSLGDREIIGTPAVPLPPSLPEVASFSTNSNTHITRTRSIKPGAFGDIALTGGMTLTFSEPGVYTFRSMRNSGNLNTFVFDFKNSTTGTFKVQVVGDANVGKSSVNIINGGSASRIFTEVHGKGTTSADGASAFTIANGGTTTPVNAWQGTVWAPYAAINVGSGATSSKVIGALWSGTQVYVNSGIMLEHAPFASLKIPFYPPPPAGKVENTIGAELYSLYYNYGNVEDSAAHIFIIREDRVYIDVIAREGQRATLLALLQTPAYGLTNLIPNGPNDPMIITGLYPIVNLLKLDSLPDLIEYVRPLYPAVGNSGIALTAGDSAQTSNFVRAGYNVQGEGVKVGVLSDSYNTLGNASVDVGNGDLPGAGNPVNSTLVQVLKEYPFGTRPDEGRAMLQIVHDIAPKAQLAFRTGFLTAGDMANGIRELADAGCGVIVDDITFITEPFFKDGAVARAVEEVAGNGVAYFTSAGNFGSKGHSDIFRPVTAPAGLTGTAHDFGSGDIYQRVTLRPGVYTFLLQWEDFIYSYGETTTGTLNDLDLYLDNGSARYGFNRNNLGGDPYEALHITVTATTQINLLVVKAAGSTNVRFKYVVFRGDITIEERQVGKSTIVGHANHPSSFAIGAALYLNTPPYGLPTPTIASFSSRGGTPVLGTVRPKPDFVAPNGGNTTVNMGGQNIDGDAFPNFFGTSAAAPHAGGAAALLIAGWEKFTTQPLGLSGLRTLLQSTAIDMGAPGFDDSTGNGFIQPYAAMQTFAAPKPVIYSLSYPEGVVPGQQAFRLKVKGAYLTNKSRIHFRGGELPTIFINTTELQADIPTFTGNPAIQVVTGAISTSGLDGGSSNSLRFFDAVKQTVTIVANDTTKRYAEAMPAFTATIRVDGVRLDSTGLTLEDLGLTTLQLQTPATVFSKVALYAIEPVRDFDSTDPVDAGLLDLYDYQFTNGVLAITKLPLTITPDDKTITYGENITGFQFDYQYDGTRITNSAALLDSLQRWHADAVVKNATLLIVPEHIVNPVRVINGEFTDETLANLSFLITENALQYARPLVNPVRVINGSPETVAVVDVHPQTVIDYVEDPTEATLVSTEYLVNPVRVINPVNIVNPVRVINEHSKTIVNPVRVINGTVDVNGAPIANPVRVINSDGVVNAITATSNVNTVVVIDSSDVYAEDNPPTPFRSINMITGYAAGTHKVVPGAFLNENFEVTYGIGRLTVLPAALTVKAESLTVEYGTAPTFASTIGPWQYDNDTTRFLSAPRQPQYVVKNAAGTIVTGPLFGAGTYTVTPTALPLVSGENFVPSYTPAYASGTLTVSAAPLTVRADDKVIYQNDVAPAFTATITGFKGTDTTTIVSGPRYALTPNYTGKAGTYTITPSALVLQRPADYAITYQAGTLYVNPKGKGARKIKPFLECVEYVPDHPSGFDYIARFGYTNDNATTLFVGHGPENFFTAAPGSYSGAPPEIFLRGTHYFSVLFNGTKLVWTVISYEVNQKAAVASEASSTSNRCGSNNVLTQAQAGAIGREAVPEAGGESLALYPNPTAGRLTIVSKGAPLGDKEVVLLDATGRRYPAKGLRRLSASSLSLDLTGLPQGSYYLRVKSGSSYQTVPVIKLE